LNDLSLNISMSRGDFGFNKSLYTRTTSSVISNFRTTRENKRESSAWVNVIWRFNAPSTLAYKVYARSILCAPECTECSHLLLTYGMQSVSGTIANLSSPFFLRFRNGSILESRISKFQPVALERRSFHAMKKRSI